MFGEHIEHSEQAEKHIICRHDRDRGGRVALGDLLALADQRADVERRDIGRGIAAVKDFVIARGGGTRFGVHMSAELGICNHAFTMGVNSFAGFVDGVKDWHGK